MADVVTMSPRCDAIVRTCARYMARRAHHSLTLDDLLQEGRMALWVAMLTGKVDAIADDEHRSRYVAARALGAMRDANRKAWNQMPLTVTSLDDGDHAPHAIVAGGVSPERAAQLQQAMQRLATRGSAQIAECVERLGAGADARDVAIAMHVAPSRISALKNEARHLVARCL